MDEFANIQVKYFSDSGPGSVPSDRQPQKGAASQRPELPRQPGITGSQLRLYAWSELPERHRNEACRQIRMRCEAFISAARVERSQRKSEIDKLVSEVVAHLLRATSITRDETTMDSEAQGTKSDAPSEPGPENSEQPTPFPWLAHGRLDQYEPSRDARVIWIVEETCNRQALPHRYEDVRRRDRGGKWKGTGYPLLAVDNQTMEKLSGYYDPGEEETGSLYAEDARRAWDGLVQLVQHHFGVDDDVFALVQVLAHDRDMQESFGSQWPIGRIVRTLNGDRSHDLWTDDRVDNAKKRLTKFVVKIKVENGLDAVDLRALLARYARQSLAVVGRLPRTT